MEDATKLLYLCARTQDATKLLYLCVRAQDATKLLYRCTENLKEKSEAKELVNH